MEALGTLNTMMHGACVYIHAGMHACMWKCDALRKQGVAAARHVHVHMCVDYVPA